jgi:catechol 2,3-dioxygenase-like lactoylglutathione lyase family enzyme
MRLTGTHHIALTVTDLARSEAWYSELFDLHPVLHEPPDGGRGAVVLATAGNEVTIGLVQHGPGNTTTFDPTVVGLDHVAFAVAERADLDRWIEKLDAAGIEHSPAVDIPPGAILNFKDPDGISLSLFWDK